MASRLHQRNNARDALFSNYEPQQQHHSPSPRPEGFRAATPDKKGRYADAVYNSLESQNEEQVGAMTEKVKMLKNITNAIGSEIRDSTALAEKMNEGFEGAGQRVRGTMRRMLVMAERTGVGWRVWCGVLVGVWVLFVWVWLF